MRSASLEIMLVVQLAYPEKVTLYLKQYVRMSVRDGVWQAD